MGNRKTSRKEARKTRVQTAELVQGNRGRSSLCRIGAGQETPSLVCGRRSRQVQGAQEVAEKASSRGAGESAPASGAGGRPFESDRQKLRFWRR